jgi:DoxX-like family
MVRKIVYWTSTAIVAVMLLSALSYLTGNPQMVSSFAKAGYPQHLRMILGIAKPAAAIVLLLPGFALLKEWAYAGAAFTWVMAVVAHYLAGDGVQMWGVPLALLALLIVSYATRPASRKLGVLPATASTVVGDQGS